MAAETVKTLQTALIYINTVGPLGNNLIEAGSKFVQFGRFNQRYTSRTLPA